MHAQTMQGTSSRTSGGMNVIGTLRHWLVAHTAWGMHAERQVLDTPL